MRHFSFDKLTFNNLTPEKVEVIGGSRPRLTLSHDLTNQRYFLKSYRHNPREIWAEMLASQLGELIGIPIQSVSLKKLPDDLVKLFEKHYKNYLPPNWRPVGALVRNVFPKNHELLYGQQIVDTASDPITLEFVEQSVRSRYIDSEDILQAFADMIIFDAWIGNMDRHHENWAIYQKNMSVQFSLLPLSNEERKRIKKLRGFTPLFDHGSSLMFELSDEDVAHYTENPQLFRDSYVLGKKYALILNKNHKRANIYEVVKEHLVEKDNWSRRFKKSITKIAGANSLAVARLILQMPTSGELEYSQDRKNLLYYSLELRKSILKDLI